MRKVPEQTDFIVAGGGVAGLRAAIELAPAGRVLVLTKQELTESATQYAQGGIAVALSDEDEIGLHLHDTVEAGDGLVDVNAARILVEEGPQRIQELLEWGTQFDREGTRLTFTREAAHSRNRILHAHGDSTGREIGRALSARARSLPSISFCEYEFIADVCITDGRVAGALLVDQSGEAHTVRASAVLLATGGIGQVFRDTTNPPVATGDGVAMAYRAGASVSDMEFVQFHPTALYKPGAPRFLLSEALRGEGAHLVNERGERFMLEHDARAELAARDVVSRAIARELLASNSEDACVYLDLRHLDRDRVRQRFPRIYNTCLQYGVDIAADLVPVRPAAHYLMGGVRTDLHGRSDIRGLFAAGETACTGVHGANRLASNSLLEGLVFGARAGATMRDELRASPTAGCSATEQGKEMQRETGAFLNDIRELMWRNAGVIRSGEGLAASLGQLEGWADRVPASPARPQREARNIYDCALLIVRSALGRQESRGGHFRSDFPARDDARFGKHSVVRDRKISFE